MDYDRFFSILEKEIGSCTSGFSNKLKSKKYLFYFFIHIAIFIILSAIAFEENSEKLYDLMDGSYMRYCVQEYHDWGNDLFARSNSPMSGLGNIQNPNFDYRFLPSTIIGAYLFNHGEVNAILVYCILSFEMFLAVYILCTLLKLKQKITTACAWAAAVLCLPWANWNGVTFNGIMPQYVEILTIQLFIISSWILLGRNIKPINGILLTTTLVIWLFIAAPIECITFLPSLAAIMLFLCLSIRSTKEFFHKTIFILLTSFILVSFFARPVLGLIKYSIFTYFPTETEPPHTFGSIKTVVIFFGNLLFWKMTLVCLFLFLSFRVWKGEYKNLLKHALFLSAFLLIAESLIHCHRHANGIFVIDVTMLGLSGLVLFALYSTKHLAWMARAILICLICIILFGVYTVYFSPHYCGIHSSYFEKPIWVFYIIFAICGIYGLLRTLSKWWAQHFVGWKKCLITYPLNMICLKFGWVGVCIALYAIASVEHSPKGTNPYLITHPEASILDHLEKALSLKPGGIFHGCVASFYANSRYKGNAVGASILQAESAPWVKPNGIGWHDQYLFDLTLSTSLGTNLRNIGLWERSIPTLFDYSHFIPPPFYAVVSRLLMRPQDITQRNVVLLTYPRIKYLEAIGVRFIITDFSMDELGQPVETLNLPNFPGYKLYELHDPNLGSYSPTQCIYSDTAEECLRFLSDDSFSFKDNIILQDRMEEKLTKATSTIIRWHKSGMRVEVTSTGPTLILLPLQYFHCLDLIPIDDTTLQYVQSANPPRLVRANLMQAALFMPGSGIMDIRFANGIFAHPSSYLKDAADMDKLQLKKISRLVQNE